MTNSNNETMIRPKREIWIDNVKVIACILVVLGHFFQSMTRSGIISLNAYNQWFDQTIYYFHVPLFFICSGYLYQRYTKVSNVSQWLQFIRKKALHLGVPYFTFSFFTWLLKTVFSSSVNIKAGGLFYTFFVRPESPYWYLYALFLIFCITIKIDGRKKCYALLVVAFLFKVISFSLDIETTLPALYYVLSNEIWFVIGMCMSVFELEKKVRRYRLTYPVIVGFVFLILSVIVFVFSVYSEFVFFILGIMACIFVIGYFIIDQKKHPNLLPMANFTMPVFLMHTLCASPIRIILLKCDVMNAAIHIVIGLFVSFAGPIILAIIMKKSVWLEFFLYPEKKYSN